MSYGYIMIAKELCVACITPSRYGNVALLNCSVIKSISLWLTQTEYRTELCLIETIKWLQRLKRSDTYLWQFDALVWYCTTLRINRVPLIQNSYASSDMAFAWRYGENTAKFDAVPTKSWCLLIAIMMRLIILLVNVCVVWSFWQGWFNHWRKNLFFTSLSG